MIGKGQVMIALAPWLGEELSRALDGSLEQITHWLNAWTDRQDLGELRGRIDSLLFRSAREATQGRLLVRTPDGGWVRMRLEDFSTMADDVLYVLLSQLPVDQKHLVLLRDFSLHQESLAALKALYLRFAPLEGEEELAAMGAFVRKCYPPFRWQGWLQ